MNLKTGKLFDDSVIVPLVEEGLKVSDDKWVLDGFPRSERQAHWLINNFKPDLFFHLKVPKETLMERINIQCRWVHEPSGRTYGSFFNQSKISMLDDITQEPLVMRCDDNKLDDRYNIYTESIKSIEQIFSANHSVLHKSFSGTHSEAIYAQIDAFLKEQQLDVIG